VNWEGGGWNWFKVFYFIYSCCASPYLLQRINRSMLKGFSSHCFSVVNFFVYFRLGEIMGLRRMIVRLNKTLENYRQ